MKKRFDRGDFLTYLLGPMDREYLDKYQKSLAAGADSFATAMPITALILIRALRPI